MTTTLRERRRSRADELDELGDGRDAAPVEDEKQVVARRRNGGRVAVAGAAGALHVEAFRGLRKRLSSLMYWLMLKAWVVEESLSIVIFEIVAASGVSTKNDCP